MEDTQQTKEKDLQIICVIPGNLTFAWETEVLINSLRDINLSDKLNILIEEQTSKDIRDLWKKMQLKYGEVSFSFWDTSEVVNLKKLYLPIIRPNILKQYFKLHPYLKDSTIFYIDSDLLFHNNKEFLYSFKDFLENSLTRSKDYNLCSKTSYIDANYFESKKKDVLSFRSVEYSTRDILAECCNIVGINKELVISNINKTGGCQWILHNLTSEFWGKVEKDCINLNIYLKEVNNRFFPNEEKGYQVWAISDMCSLLWNVWLKLGTTYCPSTLDFSWSSSNINEYNKSFILHNAGVTGKEKENMFYKGDLRFRGNLCTPFEIKEWEEIDKNFCNYKYWEYMVNIKEPVCVPNTFLNYKHSI